MDEPTSSRQADQKQWREKFLTEVLQSENKKSSHYNDEEDLKKKARKTAEENLVKQAKKMKATSDKSHPPANIGNNVTIPIPDVDKGKGDLRNIIGVILQTNDEGFYKVGTKHGVLEKLYCSFDLAKEMEKKNLALLGTIRKNKPQLPQELVTTRGRDVYSTKLGYQDKTMLAS
ncbi:hypothetical protein ILUMI_12708 [Ignelater luminosus]|uniref:PiggyBac transposable element-derived protein domain-containing protein n=1 Tax=Ignelater luminosus TaxID=2038154 RepID=A0A8K0CTP5_IGNLU|nr:hypothetical protein ILUMI_12708 [Ignelater luminosus]